MKDYHHILFPYAYNILGSAEDARDAIQEIMLKYTAKDIQPDNERNYLIRSVINESINQKKRNARMQSDNWLPEPVATDRPDSPLETKEVLSYSLLLLLEKLRPGERAVFILKEAFSYSHQDIAAVLDITVENSRKLLSRAAEKVKSGRRSESKTSADKFALLDQFAEAIRNRELDRLHDLMAEDIAYVVDGGERVRVVQKFCHGFREVGDLLVYLYHRFQYKATARHAVINHQPALLFYNRNKLTGCQVFAFSEDNRITQLATIVDPDKLKLLAVK